MRRKFLFANICNVISYLTVNFSIRNKKQAKDKHRNYNDYIYTIRFTSKL